MAPTKRKRPSSDKEDESSSEIEEVPISNNDIDLTAIFGKKSGAEEDEEDEDDFIKETISKFNMKSGTEMLKKTKGKNKITKGEVGGGSFQSMGALSCCY